MYKHHKILCFLLFGIVTIACYFFQPHITESLLQNLATIFSIIFGFYMTALSVLYGSPYSKKLSKNIDVKIKTQTELQTLKSYFKESSFLLLISLSLIILLSLILKTDGSGVYLFDKEVCTHSHLCFLFVRIDYLLSCVVLGVSSLNLFLSALLLKVLFNGFEQEAK